jgi:hypothetical protein
MKQGAAFRGQPLLLLSGLLLAWLALRVSVWQPPAELLRSFPPPIAAVAGPMRTIVPTPASGHDHAPLGEGTVPSDIEDETSPVAAGFRPRPVLPAMWPAPLPPSAATAGPAFVPPRAPEPLSPVHEAPRFVVGHNLLLAAGLSQMQVPPVLLAYLQAAPGPVVAVPLAVSSPGAFLQQPTAAMSSRWSADGWLLLRRDGEPNSPGSSLSDRPSYGRSQAGAVVRYSLAAGHPTRPLAHLRVSGALAGSPERELAAGLSARPLAGVPLRLAAEVRGHVDSQGTRFRPAVYAVTELRPVKMPFGARGEAYLQGGYVGGAFATAFVDGLARVERSLLRTGGAEVSAGVGAWGGAQKGSARLDIGPVAAVSFSLGDARGRLAADYRFRVAGDAEPTSGPALTVSAGF